MIKMIADVNVAINKVSIVKFIGLFVGNEKSLTNKDTEVNITIQRTVPKTNKLSNKLLESVVPNNICLEYSVAPVVLLYKNNIEVNTPNRRPLNAK